MKDLAYLAFACNVRNRANITVYSTIINGPRQEREKMDPMICMLILLITVAQYSMPMKSQESLLHVFVAALA
jgi:hypothetical protein